MDRPNSVQLILYIIYYILYIIYYILHIIYYILSITKLPNDACGAWQSRRAWPIDMAHRASPNGRLGRPSHPASPRVARVARPRRFERQKSTDKGAREGPRRDVRRFRVDFGIDFHRFSRRNCASDVTRGTSGRTLDFADRRGTLEGSNTLRKTRKSQKIGGNSQ